MFDLLAQIGFASGFIAALVALFRLRPAWREVERALAICESGVQSRPHEGWESWSVPGSGVLLVWDPALEQEVLGTWREDLLKPEPVKENIVGPSYFAEARRENEIVEQVRRAHELRDLEHQIASAQIMPPTMVSEQYGPVARMMLELRLKELRGVRGYEGAREILEIKRRLRDLDAQLDVENFDIEQEHLATEYGMKVKKFYG